MTSPRTQSCPKAEIKKGSCKAGEIFAGEEDTSQPGQGKLAEFTESGSLVAVWNDAGKLSAPWGMAFAPAHFGALSGMLLVGNFGDGSIAAFDAKTHDFVDVLRDSKGKPVKIDKLWGLLFGNGESLGDANSLYYAAGPRDEKDGVFGRLRPVGE
ncbi:MAG: TIGR03118 family protein [Proteobacteria bacterium]|nr:TIGR03118 family protein [Pseudomonadota bacterium]